MNHLLRVLFSLIWILIFNEQGQTKNFQTSASQLLIFDDNTSTILFEKQSDVVFFPASLTKLMTAETVFHQLKKGFLNKEQKFKVSENAWRKGGAPSGTTTMFTKEKTEISVFDLLRGLVIVNGNDAAITLAEGIAGNEANFAKLMNKRAKKLGLLNSNFVNSTGFPEEGQFITLRDIITLARHIAHEYPDYYALYSEPLFTWNKITQYNKNPLISEVTDVKIEGLGFGYSEETGFSAVISAYKNQQRLFLAVSGLQNNKERTKELKQILQWSLTNFDLKTVFTKEEIVGYASVYGGERNSVPLVVNEPINFMLSNKKTLNDVKVIIRYHGPLKAPVTIGQKIGIIQIFADKQFLVEKSIWAGANVQEGNFFVKVKDALYEVTIGRLRKYLWKYL
ncbi:MULTISPECIES: D-alanyl-D-alanine carboxypeptidase family protein [unclassified Bartonella]|uniref:D-alanyl-D-alanine carboxypeptidase family protein n=1 Tax=unclassified Bartonella TaxID=2645622 RepID=UPI00099986BB|nr:MULTISPECIES: D-alanyl-D-alanine carboxypeptidase family protein [unclassified Bartonella]AQX28013.1 D-alanyl-D-alanine carboxypeptidase (penicillin-binding protein 5/6) [Bartonella sp. JB15]AQX29289.1 D-alanyl-D-alanine carboxypeptidase (penicillin-binding protein 5/6) [Bartonella sp. JB63]